MRFPRIFLAVFSISAGFAIAGSLAGYGLAPNLASFAPPDMSYSPSTAPTGVLGDYIWAVGKAVAWLAKTPELLGKMLGMLGVPAPVVTVLLALTGISLGAWMIYLVAGRILNP